ncbi:MAG: hypothetical protein Q9169_007302 [Polycauliona sp. 2 TL-2023]
MPHKTYQTLISRQRSLTNIELNRNSEYIDKTFRPLLSGFGTVNRLRVMSGDDEVLPKTACGLLRQHKEIRHLELDLFDMPDDDDEDDEDNLSIEAIQTLFADFLSAPLELVTLHLDMVNLRQSERDVVSGFNLQVLKELRVVQCNHSDEFLSALCSATRTSPMHLERLIIYKAQHWHADTNPRLREDEQSFAKALNSLLKSRLGPLQELWVCLRGSNHMPDVAGVACHGSSLKWLFLDVRKQKGSEAVTYCLEQWHYLCQSLRVLQQLDAAYPSVIADGDMRKHLAFYSHVVRKSLLELTGCLSFQVLSNFFRTIFMPKIRVLGFNDWPLHLGANPQGDYSRFVDPTYHPLMAELATEIFRSTREANNNLKIISFGQTERLTWSRNWGYEMERLLFAKSHVEVLNGGQSIRMEMVPSRDVGYQTTMSSRREYDIDALAHCWGQYEAKES